jgi:small GTP-binding protein
MIRLKLWQWLILATPIIGIILFLLTAAAVQIHTWGLNWIWAIFTLLFVAWRWLLGKWTQPILEQVEALNQFNETLKIKTDNSPLETIQAAEKALENLLNQVKTDPPIWEDWETFWRRCQDLITAIAHVYYPDVKYPLLNIYIPQAYKLMRGTIDDLDQWMEKLAPVFNQVTIGQTYQAYEIYLTWEPSARKLLRVWDWSQWLFNPATAIAKQASQGVNNQATQQLLGNLSQMLREAVLRNLCQQAITLYSGKVVSIETLETSSSQLPQAKTQTLQEIITKAEPVEEVEQNPVNILLVGRTGAGKSSLINTLFQQEQAFVDLLPSTEQIQNYHWQNLNGETLNLWDTPGYEQVNRSDLREQVISYAKNADLLLLVTPALDPALQMDLDFLQAININIPDLPIITIVTQVDRLRPLKEWQPPYNWQTGDRPKEIAIREAINYRLETFKTWGKKVFPLVTWDLKNNRNSWGVEQISLALIEEILPAKQLRLARFLRDQETRIQATAKIIDRYTFQMTTTQGVTALLKSPILQFISTLSTGSPALAYILAQQIPVEQLPVVIGKLQMAYDLFSLLNNDVNKKVSFDLLSIWTVILDNSASPERNAWAFGHSLVEYWIQNLTLEQLQKRYNYYLQQFQ